MDSFTFDKCFHERFTDYTNILSRPKQVVSGLRIRAEWACHIELTIEPEGWQALWKIPRLTCHDFKIQFPTEVIIEVELIDYKELSALVKILAVQDEIHLPEIYDVPLIELYPTRKQKNLVLDVAETAECIDILRFFYTNLWMPWDLEDDNTLDWVNNHLESRLRLFYDMKMGTVCKKTCDIIRTLIREVRDIEAKLNKLQSDSSDEDENIDEHHKDEDEDTTYQVVQLHFRLQKLKTEMEILENPAMREILVTNQNFNGNEVEIKRRESRGRQIEAYFVWLGGTLEETSEALKSLQEFLPANIFLKTSNCLKEALNTSQKGDVIIIGQGEHQISGAGNLEEGGTLKGINANAESIIIVPNELESGGSLIELSGNELLLENMTINLKDLQNGIIVKKGLVKLSNCHIIVPNYQSIIKVGIIVFPGAKLIVQNTQFLGLGTSITVYSSAEAILSDCNFNNCTEGLQLKNKSRLTIKNVTFSNCREYAICMETEEFGGIHTITVGDVDILKNISNISIQNCKFENNAKGNVLLKPYYSAIPPAKPEEMIIG